MRRTKPGGERQKEHADRGLSYARSVRCFINGEKPCVAEAPSSLANFMVLVRVR